MDDFDANAALQYGALIAVAYKIFGPATATFTPPAMPTGFKFIAHVVMIDYFMKKQFPEIYGFVAQSLENEKSFVLALRGTMDRAEWWVDLQSAVAVPEPGFGKVGEGFGRVFQTMQVIDLEGNATTQFGDGDFAEQVAALAKTRVPAGRTLAETTPDDPDIIEINVVGHSLGSALATLYVARNAKLAKLRVRNLYTFASPRVGDLEFVQNFNRLGVSSWRIEDPLDRVTGLPPFGVFEHVERQKLCIPEGVHLDPLCLHDMNTYLHVLDPTWKLSPGCDSTNSADPTHITGH